VPKVSALVVIARALGGIKNPDDKLPGRWSTLALLARIPAGVISEGLKSGAIHKALEYREADAMGAPWRL